MASKLKERMRRRDPMVAAFCSAPSAELIEVAAYSGFDFAVIDAEHGPITVADVVHMVRAGKSSGIPVLVRVPEPSIDFVSRSLDSGVDGIIFPQVANADSARELVSKVLYPPKGKRGVAYYSRSNRFALDSGKAALEKANDSLVIGCLIETPEGVANTEKIAAVSGVDFLLMGASDLAASLISERDAVVRVEYAIDKVGQVGTKAGLSTLIAAPTPESAGTYRKRGYSIVVTGMLPAMVRHFGEYVAKAREVPSQ